MLDLEFVRGRFPALDGPWCLMDNAGGSAPARSVIERVADHMAHRPVQLGASYALSVGAGEAVAEGRVAAAALVGADPDEVVFGGSSTALAALLARALRPLWSEGDEVVVTDLDHETNIGPWRALEATGIVVREWPMRTESASLELEDLEPLLGKRTRLVAFTHCSNVVGSVHDVRGLARRIHEAGALCCVDGVAFAPHRRIDVRELDVDFYLVSLYKVYGPHIGLLYGRRELLRGARSPNHFFIGEDQVPAKLEPGNPPYELAAGVAGVLEYLEELDEHHDGTAVSTAERLERVFHRVARHEARLMQPLLAYLDDHPRVQLIGSAGADPEVRVPTVAFTVEGARSSQLPPLLDERRLATRYGHFYAYRAIDRLGLLERDGIVRVSLVHYNTSEEVQRLIEALDAAIERV